MATNAPAATAKAAYTALTAAISAPAAVYQHPPEDADVTNGIVIISDISVDAESISCKDDRDRELTLLIRTVLEAHQIKPLLALQSLVEQALDGLQVTQDGWTLSFIAKSSESILAADNTSEFYVGQNQFTVLAFGG